MSSLWYPHVKEAPLQGLTGMWGGTGSNLVSGGVAPPSGYGSVDFDGSDDYLTIADNDDWDWGGAYTIEMFVRFESHNSHDCLVHNLTDSGWSGGSWAFEYVSDDFHVYWHDGSGYGNLDGGNVVPLNQWRHHAWSYDGSTHRIYQDGNMTGSASASAPRTATNPLCIGGNCVGADYDGRIANLRITKGQALYTGGALTVPTSPLTKTSQGATASNVKLLCCNDPDNMLNATVTPSDISVGGGNPTVSSAHPF